MSFKFKRNREGIEAEVAVKHRTTFFRLLAHFVGGLTALFATLKLIGRIEWSWWAVCSPALAYLGLIILGLAAVGLIYCVVESGRVKK